MKLLLPYIKKHKFTYILGLLTLLAVDYFSLLIPQLTGMITDELSAYTLTIPSLFHYLFEILIVAGIIALGRVGWRYFLLGVSRKIERELREDMFEKLETLSQNYFHHHKTGDLMAIFTNDLDALRKALGPAVIASFDATVMTVLTLYKMIVYVDLRLTLLTLIPMSIIALSSYFVIDLMDKRFLEKQTAFARLSDYVQESMTGVRVIKSFVEEKHQDDGFEKENQYNKEKNMKVVKLMATVMPMLDFIIGISYVITLVFGGYLALTSQITLGKFVAYSQYIGMLVWPMIAFGDSVTMFSQGRAALKRMADIFNEVPEIQDKDVLDIDALEGTIDINNLSFAYQKYNVLENINLHIDKGETLAILGKTGSGKTTLVSLLMRLYNSHGITIDGHDINRIPLKVLRNHISYVPQDHYLFSDTLFNNIAFSSSNASIEEVHNACIEACVHDNIMDFPMQYETVVGERGVTLSGGQKQRCAIARALIKDAPILILDDSLSAVDTDTEDRILENLKKRHQTTIMIAHRVSTVKNADHILVLNEGKIGEYGTFEQLMNKNGLFKSMYDKQQLEKLVGGK